MDEAYIREIILQAIRTVKMDQYALIIVPEVSNKIAKGFVALASSKQDIYFDVYTPREFPENLVKGFKDHKLFLRNQFTDHNLINLNLYSQLYLLDLQPGLLKEISDVRPVSPSSKLIIDGLVENKKIQIIRGFYWSDCILSPFIKSFKDDVNKLRTWGIMLPNQNGANIYLDDRLITASKLKGYENKSIMVDKTSIITSQASEYARKNKITVIV